MGSFRPGQDKTSTQHLTPEEQLETSVTSEKGGNASANVVPDSDSDDEDMFAVATQAVNETDDEAFGPTQAVNETVDEPLATQAVDETVDDSIVEETEGPPDENKSPDGNNLENNALKIKRVDTEARDNLFNRAESDFVSKCETKVLDAETQGIEIDEATWNAPKILAADTQAVDLLEAVNH